MALSLNKHEIGEMRSYAENLGVDFRFDPVLNLRLDGSCGPAEFRISPDEVVALDLEDERRMQGWRTFMHRFGDFTSDPALLYNCGAALDSFHVDPYGIMSACMMARTPGYDLRGGHFAEGWHEFLPQVREKKPSKYSPCGTCRLIALCGQCPGWAQLENADPEGPVEYLCAIAHLRAKAFGLPEDGRGEQR
jgi:radical SAM protein with 4Fe4S-binding SPASM domain